MRGRFFEPVQFQRSAGVDDDFGGKSTEWEDLLDGRGWIRETPGKEKISAGLIEGSATATLRIRTSGTGPAWGVTAGDRVIARGHCWHIKAAPIDPDGRGVVVEFILERREKAE